MAFSGGQDTVLLANGYDVSSYFKRSGAMGTADALDSTTYGKNSKTYLGGLKDGRLSGEGLFVGAVGEVDEILEAALGNATLPIFTLYPQDDALGATGRGFRGVESAYGIDAPVEGLVAVSLEVMSDVGLEPVKSLHALSQDPAGTTNGTSLDNAASSASGGVGYLHVTDVGAALTTATVKIQHSVDNSVWADLITFTAVTADRSKERMEVAGTVNRYLRYTVTATGDTITHQVSFGRY